MIETKLKCGCKIRGTPPYVKDFVLCDKHLKQVLTSAMQLVAKDLYKNLVSKYKFEAILEVIK